MKVFRFTLTFTVLACSSTASLLSDDSSTVDLTQAVSPQPVLTEKIFRLLHHELQPAPDEPWRTIPWKIDLLDAQRTAAKEKKPIFIWAMDGHPLGCT